MKLSEYLTKAFELISQLPHDMQAVMDTTSSDSEGGYGWFRTFHISIYEIGSRCRKCGESTVDRFQNDFLNRRGIPHRHSWCVDERLVFQCTFYDMGYHNDVEIEELEKFINYRKNRQ